MKHATNLPELIVRRLLVDLQPGFSRHWNGGDAFLTAFCNALSMSFPVGEQYFIDAVKAGQQRLDATDPDAAQWHALTAAFIGQEAVHRHLHAQYNAELARQGLVNHWELRARARIDRLRRQLRARRGDAMVLDELAVTAAFEHYTALLGDMVFSRFGRDGDWFLHAEEPLRTLWYWHASEESEHRAVAFELYARLGGSRARRAFWFIHASGYFLADATLQTLSNLRRDGTLWRPATWRGAARFLFGRWGLVWRVVPAMSAYLRRDFHPAHYGDAAPARAWLREHAAQWRAVAAPPA